MYGKERRLFLTGAVRRNATEPQPEPLAARALATLAQAGRMTQTELADALGVSRQALHYHVKRLAADGKLVARVDGRDLVLSIPPTIAKFT